MPTIYKSIHFNKVKDNLTFKKNVGWKLYFKVLPLLSITLQN